jgi:uncharacterized protein GlcG (DUF336 family)
MRMFLSAFAHTETLSVFAYAKSSTLTYIRSADICIRSLPTRDFNANTDRESSFMPRQIPSLTLADARQLIAAGEKKAQELGIPYNLAVVDAGGGLVAHIRMDGAWLGSVDISINKAWTARAFDMETEKLGKMAQSGKPLFGIDSTNHEKVVIFGGGIPLKMGDVVVGALGASGGTVDQDLEVAKAAVAAFASK